MKLGYVLSLALLELRLDFLGKVDCKRWKIPGLLCVTHRVFMLARSSCDILSRRGFNGTSEAIPGNGLDK